MNTLEYVYISINAALYVILFFFYHKKVKTFTLGKFLILIWSVSAVLALLYEPNNFIGHYHTIQLWPFFFIFFLNIIAFYPILKFRHDEKIYLVANSKMLIVLGVVLGVLSAVPFAENLVYALAHSSSAGYDQLLLNMDERYADSSYDPISYLSGPSHLLTRLLNFLGLNLLTLLLVMFPAFVDVKKHKLAFAGIVIANLNFMLKSMNIFARFNIAVQLVMLICGYIIAKDFYTPYVKKKFNRYFLVAGILIVLVFSVISVYRLQGHNSVSKQENVGFAVYIGQYLCEGMPNFSADRSRAEIFDRIEEMERGIRSSLFRESRIPKYRTNELGYRGELIGPQFSTWIGNFYLSLGPYLIVIVFLMGAKFIQLYIPKHEKMTFIQCWLIIAYLRMMILGICYNTYAVGADELVGEIILIPTLFYIEKRQRRHQYIAINQKYQI